MAFNNRDDFLDALWNHIFDGDEPQDEDEQWFEEKVAKFFDKLDNDNSSSNNSGNDNNGSGGNSSRRRRRGSGSGSNPPRRTRRQASTTTGSYGSSWFS